MTPSLTVDEHNNLVEYFASMGAYYRYKLFAPGVFASVGAPFTIPPALVSRMELAAVKIPSADVVRDLFRCIAYLAARTWYISNDMTYIKDEAVETRLFSLYSPFVARLSKDDLLEYIGLEKWTVTDEFYLIIKGWYNTAKASTSGLDNLMSTLTM